MLTCGENEGLNRMVQQRGSIKKHISGNKMK